MSVFKFKKRLSVDDGLVQAKNIISRIIAGLVSVQEIDNYPWTTVPSTELRFLFLEQEFHNNYRPDVQFLFRKFINANLFFFEDFVEMSESWQNVDTSSTKLVLAKVSEVGKFAEKVPEADLVRLNIQRKGYPSYDAMKNYVLN